jgi:hypothetical protein
MPGAAMTDFERTELPDGTVRVNMSRLTDGRQMCCICFRYFERKDLAPVEHESGLCGCAMPCVWNVCKPCMKREKDAEGKS